MANLNNNKSNQLPLKLTNHSLTDFFLSNSNIKIYRGEYLYDKCLITEINTNDTLSIIDETLVSNNYVWDDAINKGITLYDIGVTGIDNGLVDYNPTTQKVMDVFTKTIMEIEENDIRLSLKPINGYYHNLNYNISDSIEHGLKFKSLNGGFYQAFYKLHNYPYQILPNKPNSEWSWEFVLRPKDIEIENTLNEKFPNNKGIFFYMGARAENKFYYFNQKDIKMETSSDYFLDDYLESGNDVKLEDLEDVKTSSGLDYGISNVEEIITDNKYLGFDRTKNGFTTKTYDGEKFKILLRKRKNDNKYLTYDRTNDGLNTKIETDDDIYDSDMNILKDVEHNSIAFRIKDDGSIGFRYYIKCQDDTDNMIEEYSKPNMVKINKWNHIFVRMITNGYIEDINCDNRQRKCKLYFYVNGKLIFISSEIDEPIFKPLNEHREKQQGVPYNISVGGGTLGLYETILHDNPNLYEREQFPIEKYFAGSMFGDILKFRFHSCEMDFTKIKNNYLFERNYLIKYNIY